jgi:hypothetical protein
MKVTEERPELAGHVRESVTPLAVDGGPNELLIDCSCGDNFTIPAGRDDERDRVDATMWEHTLTRNWGPRTGQTIITGVIVDGPEAGDNG